MDFYNGDKAWSKTEKITSVGKVHRIFGYIMLFAGNLACALGTENYVKLFMKLPSFCIAQKLMNLIHC